MELYCDELTRHLKSNEEVDLDLYVLPGNQDGSAPRLWKIGLFFSRAIAFLLFSRTAYDVIHFGDFVLFPLAWLRSLVRRQERRVLTVYGLDLTFGRKRGILPAIYRVFINWSVRNQRAVDQYIAISRFTRKLAYERGLQNVNVVRLGIEIRESGASLSPASGGGDWRNCQLLYVFYIGRVVPRKGVIWFADHVLPRLPENVELYVAGRFYRMEDEKRLRRLDRVRVLGQVSKADAAALRRDALAVIMPNVRVENNADVEGFGLAALEAPAQGAVLVASMLEGIEDAVIDGVTGLAAIPGDADDWVKKINIVMCWTPPQRAEFIRRARDVIKERYSWQRVADETVAVYLDALHS
jgi:phosphatidylinositol alpha-1,6-mannosyltransferase